MTSARGFSVIELLIVVTMLGTLSAIGVPAYMEALDRARVARAAGDISAIGREAQVFAVDESRYPNDLGEIDRQGTLDPYGNAYRYLRIEGASTGAMRKDRFLVPLNSDFDLYSAGKDGETQPPLGAAVSWDDVVRANDGGYIGLASEY